MQVFCDWGALVSIKSSLDTLGRIDLLKDGFTVCSRDSAENYNFKELAHPEQKVHEVRSHLQVQLLELSVFAIFLAGRS